MHIKSAARRLVLEPCHMLVRSELDCRLASRIRWSDVRLRVHRRLEKAPVVEGSQMKARMRCGGTNNRGELDASAASLAGSEVIRVRSSDGPQSKWVCADSESLREWMAASLVGGTLNAEVVDGAHDAAGLAALVDASAGSCVTKAQPVQTDRCEGGDTSKWLQGAIDPCAVQVLHSTTPRFFKWLRYAQALERQTRPPDECLLQPAAGTPANSDLAAAGNVKNDGERAPLVKISWNPLMAACSSRPDSKPPRWPVPDLRFATHPLPLLPSSTLVSGPSCLVTGVVNDGAHRTYAARLVGAPLAVRWKRQQLDWESLSDEVRTKWRSSFTDRHGPSSFEAFYGRGAGGARGG